MSGLIRNVIAWALLLAASFLLMWAIQRLAATAPRSSTPVHWLTSAESEARLVGWLTAKPTRRYEFEIEGGRIRATLTEWKGSDKQRLTMRGAFYYRRDEAINDALALWTWHELRFPQE